MKFEDFCRISMSAHSILVRLIFLKFEQILMPFLLQLNKKLVILVSVLIAKIVCDAYMTIV